METRRFKVIVSKSIEADVKNLVDFEIEIASYLDMGWKLHGSLQIDSDGCYVQSLFLPMTAWEEMNGESNSDRNTTRTTVSHFVGEKLLRPKRAG